MTKIMLVEDDNNLREIYEARLAAEGYEIVAAPDGEAALALAARERPELIITDVMMPKISGFEMLDILRNTENLRDVKVIMLTALGQAEDNARADALGADRYLVKSQVTLEDIIKATHDVLDGPASVEVATAAGSVPVEEPVSAPAQSADPVAIAADDTTDTPTAAPAQDGTPVPDVTEPETTAEPAPETDLPTFEQPAEQTVNEEPAELAIGHGLPAETSDNAWSPQAAAPEQPTDTTEATPAQAEAQAQPASVEESDIRAQIDQFLQENDTTTDSTQPAAIPSADDTSVMDDPASDFLPEEPEDEIAKNDSSPDMGILSVRDEPEVPAPVVQSPDAAPASEATPTPEVAAAPVPNPVATPGYPSQPFELPSVPGTAQDVPAPVQPQSAGDQLVSDAVSDMIANTPTAAPLPQTTAAPTPQTVVSGGNTATAGSSEAPQAATTPYGSPVPVSHKRVITPMGSPSRPDINQLLAIENAKAAAANNTNGQPQQSQPQPYQPAQPWQQGQNNGSVDPNSISL